MWILLTITLFAANTNIQTQFIQRFNTSDECKAARQILQGGKTQPGVSFQFVCQRKP